MPFHRLSRPIAKGRRLLSAGRSSSLACGVGMKTLFTNSLSVFNERPPSESMLNAAAAANVQSAERPVEMESETTHGLDDALNLLQDVITAHIPANAFPEVLDAIPRVPYALIGRDYISTPDRAHLLIPLGMLPTRSDLRDIIMKQYPLVSLHPDHPQSIAPHAAAHGAGVAIFSLSPPESIPPLEAIVAPAEGAETSGPPEPWAAGGVMILSHGHVDGLRTHKSLNGDPQDFEECLAKQREDAEQEMDREAKERQAEDESGSSSETADDAGRGLDRSQQGTPAKEKAERRPLHEGMATFQQIWFDLENPSFVAQYPWLSLEHAAEGAREVAYALGKVVPSAAITLGVAGDVVSPVASDQLSKVILSIVDEFPDVMAAAPPNLRALYQQRLEILKAEAAKEEAKQSSSAKEDTGTTEPDADVSLPFGHAICADWAPSRVVMLPICAASLEGIQIYAVMNAANFHLYPFQRFVFLPNGLDISADGTTWVPSTSESQ